MYEWWRDNLTNSKKLEDVYNEVQWYSFSSFSDIQKNLIINNSTQCISVLVFVPAHGSKDGNTLITSTKENIPLINILIILEVAAR